MKDGIKLVYVDSKYIRYLYRYDNRVMYNKGQRRPYIGILFEVKNHKYYAPLTHPKEKFKTMRNCVDFIRIQGGELGGINLNNMIPIVDGAATPILVKDISDIKYKMLLIKQIEFFDDHETSIIDKATKLYKAHKSKTLRKEVYARCCNFSLLEKKSKFYDPNYGGKTKQGEKMWIHIFFYFLFLLDCDMTYIKVWFYII